MAGALLLLIGCSGRNDLPQLGNVVGTVTLDGQPLEGASVEFEPLNSNPSVGVTDTRGNYKLTFHRNAEGALIGMHKVRISTFRQAYPDNGGNPVPGAPERVPKKYNRKTELEAEVKAGSQVLDFELMSDGKAAPPAAR